MQLAILVIIPINLIPLNLFLQWLGPCCGSRYNVAFSYGDMQWTTGDASGGEMVLEVFRHGWFKQRGWNLLWINWQI